MKRSTLLGPVLLVSALALVIAACGSLGSAPSTPPAVGSPDPVRATDTEGRFELTFELPRSTWRSDEPIQGEARLSLTDGAAATLHGSGSGMIAFEFREVGGGRMMGPAVTADCAPHSIAPGTPIVTPIIKSGGWSEDEPNAAFYRDFLNDPLLHLPAGEWDITVLAQFDDSGTCTRSPLELEATVRVRVVD